jgi:probable rRNA maturation factor
MSSPRSSLLFSVPARGVPRRALRVFAKRLETEVSGGRAFCCLVSSDKQLRVLNRRFRGKDYATDVLSFPADGQQGSLGEIAISFDRAREQASEYRHAVDQEIRILMLHGVLHLMGMDHERDRGRMARAEQRWRGSLGLPTGLIERTARIRP